MGKKYPENKIDFIFKYRFYRLKNIYLDKFSPINNPEEQEK